MRFVRVAIAFAVVALGARLHACTIPVFRYALDRWPADKFRLEISKDDARDPAVSRFLRNFTDSTPVNIDPVRLSTDGSSQLLFPHTDASASPVVVGPLGSTLDQIIDSPARTEIVRRILAGENGVWVLVESGQREVDDAAARTMEKRLGYLAQVAAMPPIDPDDPSSRLGPGPALRVGFSLLRVKHDDPAEQPFLKMLAGPKGAPAAPWFGMIFGRGRVLGAWPAEGFGDEQIDEACLFLLGACSCQVKRMNPGWDLLLHADWDEKLQAIGFPTAEPSAPALAQKPSAAPETVAIAPAAPVAPATMGSASAVWPNFKSPLVIAAFSLLVLGGGVAWWSIRPKP
jgi:hypothetical protein